MASASGKGSGRSSSSTVAPRDAKAVAALLKGMGVEKYEPAVVHMLMDVMHGHVTSLLHTARGLADHAGKPEIDLDDLRLAAVTQRAPPELPGRADVLAVARERNAVPLPLPPRPEETIPELFPLPPPCERLNCQNETEVELPLKRSPNASTPEGPWVVTPEERKEIEQNEIRRRLAAIAAVNAAASASSSARAAAVVNAATVQRPAGAQSLPHSTTKPGDEGAGRVPSAVATGQTAAQGAAQQLAPQKQKGVAGPGRPQQPPAI